MSGLLTELQGHLEGQTGITETLSRPLPSHAIHKQTQDKTGLYLCGGFRLKRAHHRGTEATEVVHRKIGRTE
jgi:hypothetical protein